MRILGIDPGHWGALSILELELKHNRIYYDIISLPISLTKDSIIDSNKVSHFVRENKFDDIYLEHVHAIFGSGAKNTFNFGRAFGNLEGLLGGMGLSYSLVPPREWQKAVWLPELQPLKNSEMSAKEKSSKTVKTLFPDLDIKIKLKNNKVSKNDHDGIIDAILIALYGIKETNFDFGGVLPPYISSSIEQQQVGVHSGG